MGLQIYDFVSFFFTLLLDIFFREIRPRGAHKVPKQGPVIFVAGPHANQVRQVFVFTTYKQNENTTLSRAFFHRTT
jgi:1-acyl-sn-glycerol-3-phosphate acyltransferase